MPRSKGPKNRKGGGGGGNWGWGFCACGIFVVLIAYGWKTWTSRRDSRQLRRLRSELAAHGASVDGVRVEFFSYPGGARVRGLASTRDCAEGGVLAGVSRSAILSDYSIDTRVVDIVSKTMGKNAHDPAVARDIAVAAGLLRERHLKGRSDFNAYVESMPTKAEQPDNLPWWDDAQLDALSSVLAKFSIWKRLTLESLMNIVASDVSLFGRQDISDCQWALSVVVSRQVHAMLMPLLDQANHNTHPNAKMDCNPEGCRLLSRRFIAANEEVTITYGDKPNIHLLQAYGFSIPGNNISALHLDLSRLEGTRETCKSERVLLNHEAALALAPATVACLEKAVGRCRLVKAVAEDCSRQASRLSPPPGTQQTLHQKALGIRDSVTALKALTEREPARGLDSQITNAIQQELRTVGRCAEEAEAELLKFGPEEC